MNVSFDPMGFTGQMKRLPEWFTEGMLDEWCEVSETIPAERLGEEWRRFLDHQEQKLIDRANAKKFIPIQYEDFGQIEEVARNILQGLLSITEAVEKHSVEFRKGVIDCLKNLGPNAEAFARGCEGQLTAPTMTRD